MLNERLRGLPAVHTLLNSPTGRGLAEKFGHQLAVEAAGAVLDLWRKKLLAAEKNNSELSTSQAPASTELYEEMEAYLAAAVAPHLKRVVNATGIILHTNLGRSLLSAQARKALDIVAAGYCNLEYELSAGTRGERYTHIEALLTKLTGAESALTVNNNAAAILLVLNSLAAGKEVIVSRGELVEIGGSFRIPEVLKLGGVRLVEVGTTNRTYLKDYREAITENTGLLLKVHTSNYRITGFTGDVKREELVQLAAEKELPVVEDLGSGSLINLSAYGLCAETPIPEVIKAGVDLVTFSGDKLLGGPQAGLIVGKKAYIKQMKANQLTRAIRIDKLSLAALEATLREYLRPETVAAQLPLYQMLTASLAELTERGEAIQKVLSTGTQGRRKLEITLESTQAQMGGGSLPGQEIPSVGLFLNFTDLTPMEAEQAFRSLPVPIVGYIDRNRYILDLRTLLPGDEEIIIRGIEEIIN